MPKIHDPKIHDTYCRHFQALASKHMSQIRSTSKLFQLRYMGVIWLLLLIGHMYLIGMWYGYDQRTNGIKEKCVFKEIGLFLGNFINHYTSNNET